MLVLEFDFELELDVVTHHAAAFEGPARLLELWNQAAFANATLSRVGSGTGIDDDTNSAKARK